MACLTYARVLQTNTGHRLTDPQEFNRSRDMVASASMRMALKLEAQGIPAFREGRTLHAIGDVSGDVECVATEFRNILLIPDIAKRKRAETIRELAYFVENHPRAKHFRYMVATSGDRVPLCSAGALRSRRSKFLGRLRRFMSEAGQRWGVRFLYRGDEYTFNEMGAHFHENLIYYPSRYLRPDDWQAFLAFARSRLGQVWNHDGGKIKNLREVVKYVCKLSGNSEQVRAGGSGASWGADELTGPELAWLYHETVGGHSSQPLGEFADWLADMRQERQKVVGLKSAEGATSLRLMQKPKKNPKPREATGGQNIPENIIINRTLPVPSKDGIFEPRTLVLGYTASPATGVGRDGLALISSNQRQAREWASQKTEAHKSGPFNVHNTTRSVHDASRCETIRPNRQQVWDRWKRQKQREQEANRPKPKRKPYFRVRFVDDFPGDWSADDARWQVWDSAA